jgi:F-type H+-transporting ATPase subunit gamma
MALRGGIKFLRKRIRAVRNIRKLTKAMKTVASVRLRKAQPILLNSKEFIENLEKIFSVSYEPKEEFLIDMKFNESKNSDKIKRLYIILGSDRGLCGAFNSNILRLAQSYIKQDDIIWAFGTRVARFLSKKYKNVKEFRDFWRDLSYEKIEKVYDELSSEIKKRMEEDGWNLEVYCIFTLFKSAGTQIPTCEKIYPIYIYETWGPKRIFEPSREKLLDFFSEAFLKAKLFYIFQSSITSEHAMRMRAMDMATQNSDRLIKVLTLQMNKARQEAITKELIDIVNGKNALEAQAI